MDDENDNTKKALAQLGVGPAAAEMYKDLLRPAAQELGKNLHVLATVITVALSPVHGLVWGADRVRDWLAVALLRRLSRTPPAEIVSPKGSVAGQTLLQLSFCEDEGELRRLYANLLASAMKRKTASSVHPAFVHVIEQLSPDEAILLRHVAPNLRLLELKEEYSDTDYRKNVKSIASQFRDVCQSASVQNLEQSDGYLDNLLRIRILREIPYTEGRLHGGQAVWDAPDATLENLSGRILEISAFGAAFISTCVADPIEP